MIRVRGIVPLRLSIDREAGRCELVWYDGRSREYGAKISLQPAIIVSDEIAMRLNAA